MRKSLIVTHNNFGMFFSQIECVSYDSWTRRDTTARPYTLHLGVNAYIAIQTAAPMKIKKTKILLSSFLYGR